MIVAQSYWLLLNGMSELALLMLKWFQPSIYQHGSAGHDAGGRRQTPASPGRSGSWLRKTLEDNEIQAVNPSILWDSVVISINKVIMMTMFAARGHFPRKSLLPSAQQAPLLHSCAWFAEALIWRQPSERGTKYVKLASSVIDSDTEFDREHTIKRDFNSGLPTATSD